MLSMTPIDLRNLSKSDIDREILRVALMAELDAINLYEQMAAVAKDRAISKILLDIAKEEKTHVGELQALLLIKDEEQRRQMQIGQREVDEIVDM